LFFSQAAVLAVVVARGGGMGLLGEQERGVDLVAYDRALAASSGAQSLAGLDEAGRGPLAGPVVVAAVMLPLGEFELPVRDSKALGHDARETLAAALLADARLRHALVVKSAARIDQINILRATHEAMREAALALQPSPELVLVDGLRVPDFPLPAHFLVKGDALSASIAAASILAKTHRDRLMLAYDRDYPGYGFAQHKGYGTAQHLAALRRLGPCPIHRRSFAPVAQLSPAPSKQLTLNFSARSKRPAAKEFSG
jgi:ribonuclease HII